LKYFDKTESAGCSNLRISRTKSALAERRALGCIKSMKLNGVI